METIWLNMLDIQGAHVVELTDCTGMRNERFEVMTPDVSPLLGTFYTQ